MAVEGMRRLSLGEAVALHEAAALALKPATLHPLYVEADAARDPLLQPVYLAFEAAGALWMHALHLTQVPGTPWKDTSSPYGYGGPLCNSHDPGFLREAWSAYCAWMRAESVAVEYVRFHPLLNNHLDYGGKVESNREVVCVDLTPDDVAAGYAARLRQAVKRAERSGLRYEEKPLAAGAAAFGAYYRAAMREIGADPFYLFDDGYFEALAADGLARVGVCTQPDGAGDWLAACLMLDGKGVREYHLAATTAKGRSWGASSFALHNAALAARRQGACRLYLGGGTDRQPDNPLLFFKSGFSPQRLVYRTGWSVFDAAAYEDLKQRFAQAWRACPERPIFYRKV